MAIAHYFVDEAGDTTLFGRFGKVLTGTQSASRYFIVGRLEVDDLAGLSSDMHALRGALLADPLINSIPSMRPDAGKTARYFHAKDDAPEVRHAVFKLLLRHDLRFHAVVKDKLRLLDEVQERTTARAGPRYKADGHELYDTLCTDLFGHFGRLGMAREVTFAIRGTKPRTAALQAVLDAVDQGFHRDHGFAPHGATNVHSAYPTDSCGLQACDYLLWALQRFYERGEERFLSPLWPKFSRVLDLDAPRRRTEFNEKHPLNLLNRAGVRKEGPGDIG